MDCLILRFCKQHLKDQSSPSYFNGIETNPLAPTSMTYRSTFQPLEFIAVSHWNISTPFLTVNNELHEIREWFKANRLSSNVKNTKYTFFHKNSVKENLPLKLPENC